MAKAPRAPCNWRLSMPAYPQIRWIISMRMPLRPTSVTCATRAIKQVFGEHAYKVSISSTKSMTGHLLGGAGGVEMAACALAIRDSVIPPTINLENPGEGCDLNYTANVARERKVRVALNNSFGFGGHNATLVATAFEK